MSGLKIGLYAGSFDPWTHGHKFILDSSLEIFDRIHIVTAINPSKQSILKPETRARVIANSIDPFHDWWTEDPPFQVNEKVIVSFHEGLIADYAAKHNIIHLIRGLRSTTDFEAEFNLYFSNQAIDPKLQTWAIMCPPRLLHCSSTYVKTVVGKPQVKFVGTTFTSQSLILGFVRVIGELFDLIEAASKHRFDIDPLNLSLKDLSEALQLLFSKLCQLKLKVPRSMLNQTHLALDSFLKKKRKDLVSQIQESHEYPESEINFFWALLARCVEEGTDIRDYAENGVGFLLALADNIGRTPIKLFYENEVMKEYVKLIKK